MESALKQTEVNQEVIVVDVSSKQNSSELLKPVLSQIRYESLPEQGIISACNHGLEVARGEFLIFLSPKSYLFPHAVAKRLTCLRKQGASLEMLLGAWENNFLTEKSMNPIDLKSFSQWVDGCQGFHIWALPTLWYYVTPSGLTFRRNWLQMLGGLDSRLSLEIAIVDAVLQLSSRGAMSSFLEETTCGVLTNSQQREKMGIIAQDLEIILNKFFSRRGLKSWEFPLQSQARYNIWVWMAWQMYQQNHFAEGLKYLKHSLRYSPFDASEVTANWKQRFHYFSTLQEQSPNPDLSQEMNRWQKIIAETFETQP